MPTEYQIFVRTLVGKTNAYTVTVDHSVEDLKKKVCEREGLPIDSVRLVYGGKDISSGDLKDHNIQEQSTLYVLCRLRGGGQVEPAVLWELLATELPDALRDMQHTKHTCAFCTEDDRDCITACCLNLCDECIITFLKEREFSFLCTVCKKKPELESFIPGDTIRNTAIAYREITALLRNVNVQLCRCATISVNETMYAQQRCVRCKLEHCFFCRKEWDKATMTNNRYHCSPDCCYASLMKFSLVTFTYYHDGSKTRDIMPSHRFCPSCGSPGAYDAKCKYHVCSCGHSFCFLCLESEKVCEAKSRYDRIDCIKTDDGKPRKQEYSELPHLKY